MAERNDQTAPAETLPEAWGRREPGDDFFCLRYRIWYPSYDCAVRTKFHTAPGCARCDQGQFNHRRHADALRGVRFRVLPGETPERANEA